MTSIGVGVICAMASTFLGTYNHQASEALKFIKAHNRDFTTGMPNLTAEERVMAQAIVAPEVSMYSSVTDAMELHTMYVIYYNTGAGNFSVGWFQMKPSFVEDMEAAVSASKSLMAKYSHLLPKGTDREKRHFRLDNLSTLDGQIAYLQLFIAIVKGRTATIDFATPADRVRYWATLYNSGIYLSPAAVARQQQLNQFPSRGTRYNYGNTAVEFYKALKDK